MAPSFITIDSNDMDVDFSTPKPVQAKRTLLLAPPPLPLKRINSATSSAPSTDQSQTYKCSTGSPQESSPSPATTYDLVLILTDTDGTRRSEALKLLTREVYATLVPAMKPGAKLQTQDSALNASDAMEAVLAGLVQSDNGFEKPNFDPSAAVPLKFGLKKKNKPTPPTAVPVIPSFSTGFAAPMGIDSPTNHDRDDDDELINEDTLLSEEDLTRPIMPPPECQPKTGRRRRACKDCSCGLADKLEAEDKERRANADKELNVMKLDTGDLAELDFTVEGKTGSCGSCALGDAFRCDGCPYMGLPAFKPGQEVQILNDVAQL
ncbi:Cytokine-induced anti-apoptosis inhibitor 1 [Penicillium verrucosum]|uniref:Cytokine-induced anti-apoptosis inhibitor 1 n=1 Tax=Penicillium verrucosum TaxID=60171 RepID=UPI00254500CB|nr:Cytokine-induced anti-apoptosis inhibitor 1 [Penicillium verrucosum]KAJ5945167.1 Cytokine-induced anti-apoptosis inhibitor 1 [Penicillium verrucosum]